MLTLLVSSPPDKRTVFGRALLQLISDVEQRAISLLVSESLSDATSILNSDPAIQCVLLSWEMDDSEDHDECIKLLTNLRERNTRVPVFLISDRSSASSIPLVVMQYADDFIWLPEDTSRFLSGRVLAAIERYRKASLPPMFGALVRFASSYEYSWHTPGPCRRHGVSQEHRRPGVLRVLRGKPAAFRPVHLGRGAGFAAGSQRPHRPG
nr:Orn/Lys/Arg decarboxylase N-terminal domain-containing protein [Pseudomonas mediterranea]